MAYNKKSNKKRFLNAIIFFGILFAKTINTYSSSSATQESIDIPKVVS